MRISFLVLLLFMFPFLAACAGSSPQDPQSELASATISLVTNPNQRRLATWNCASPSQTKKVNL